MTMLDHSDFIKRHHTPQGPAVPQHTRGLNLWVMGLVVLAYLAFCIATIVALDVHDTAFAVFLLLIIGALLGGFALHMLLKILGPEERERQLLREVMEASRSARLIVDGANATVLKNTKFDELCAPVGHADFYAVLQIFADTDETRAHFHNLADQAHRGLMDQIQLKIRRDDQDVWIKITAQPVPGWAGHVHWRFDDITEEYARNWIIAEEREKLIDFTDNAPVGFFSVDEQGRFVFVNATFARWVGEGIETLLNNRRLHYYLQDAPRNAHPYEIIEGGGVRQVAELKIKGAQGRTFLASVTQTVVHEPDGRVRTRAVVNDLTAERAMRQALEVSEDRFQKFFADAPLGIVIINKDRKVEDCNQVMAALVGKTIESIEGQNVFEVIDRTDWQHVTSILDKVARNESSLDPVEVKLWSSDVRQSFPSRLYARKITGSSSIALHFIDLTQQKNLESQFIQSQKMQAVGQLAGGVAHDFNNLLTAIIGFCDLLLLRHKPGDPSFGDIQQIKQNSNRAANLVRQLLAFSRQQTLRPKVQDITDILTELAHLLRRLIGVQIDLKLVHGDDLGFVRVDGGQMEQVLVNMAVNARDAMPQGGVLAIETARVTTREPIRYGEDVMAPGDWVRIRVTDTGTGIPPEILERIFEPFFTTKDVGQGTGLGLATVYGIVRQSGGYLQVESVVGAGTTFSIYLPRLVELDTADDAPIVTSESVSDLTGSARILLVEDEDAVRAFGARALTNKGYEVLTAETGEAGWTVFENLDKPIDLMVTDVMMPGMDGPTLAKKIREKQPDLKIIFVSGYTEDKLKDHMDDHTFFLPKPFTLKELAAKVKDVLGER
jgi:two-component system, cell cycle sensor histidine kinase and response regulator CckA